MHTLSHNHSKHFHGDSITTVANRAQPTLDIRLIRVVKRLHGAGSKSWQWLQRVKYIDSKNKQDRTN